MSRSIDLRDKLLTEIDAYLDEAAEGLTDVSICIETEYNYGDSEIIVQTVEGWRPATDAEIQTHENSKRVAKERKRQLAKQDLERIRREHPDLLP